MVPVAMPAPHVSGLLTAWTWQPVALVLAALLIVSYVLSARRGGSVARRSAVLFPIGLLALVYTTCGFPGAYLDSLFWVWTSQQLALLLVVPYLLLAGGTLRLLSGPRLQRLLATPFLRFIANPLVGPALVPVVSFVLFFGPVPGWSIQYRAVGWFEQVAVLAVGALVVLPLVDSESRRSSLAVGLALAFGSFELVLDAVPGIALRLHRSLSTSYFDHRALWDWSPAALRDQQIAGSVLWCVAELLDLPFLILVFRQWLRADARDAADIDAVLEAERIARGADQPDEAGEGPTDAPWWLNDPSMQERLRRR